MRSQEELALITAIADDLPAGVWVAAVPDGRCVYANRTFERIMGTGPRAQAAAGAYAEPYGIHARDGTLYPEEKLPFVRAQRERRTVVVDDLVIHRPDGSRSFVRAFGKPMFDDAGEITHVAVAFFDIAREIRAQTAQERAEAERTELRDQLTRVVDHAPIVLFAFGRDGVVTMVEGQGLTRIGLVPKDFLGRSMFDIYPANPIIAASAHRALGGETVTYTSEIKAARAGTYETRLAPVFDEQGVVVGALGVSMDVTDRVRAEAQLAQAERLASIGMIAAGVAHEINNPLSFLIGSLDLVEHRLEQAATASELRAMIHTAREGAERIRAIVRDLKVFSGVKEQKRTAVDVRAAVEAALRIAGNELRHRARVSLDLQDVPTVKGDEGRLGQVFLNLLVNAAQAIPEGDSEKNEVRVSTRRTGNGPGDRPSWVCVEVSDTGPGIPADLVPKVFDPFFTTKPVGAGTGLGLAICRAIVTEAGGRIEVENRPGGGSTFRVLLPPAEGASAPPPALSSPSAPAARTRATVLLVDDEQQILKICALILEPHHDVTCETRADAALERIRRGERFDVILCDLMMPQMTGMDLHSALLTVAPDQARAMLFLTGGAFTARAQAFLEGLSDAAIEKPFDPATLVRRISEKAQSQTLEVDDASEERAR